MHTSPCNLFLFWPRANGRYAWAISTNTIAFYRQYFTRWFSVDSPSRQSVPSEDTYRFRCPFIPVRIFTKLYTVACDRSYRFRRERSRLNSRCINLYFVTALAKPSFNQRCNNSCNKSRKLGRNLKRFDKQNKFWQQQQGPH